MYNAPFPNPQQAGAAGMMNPQAQPMMNPGAMPPMGDMAGAAPGGAMPPQMGGPAPGAPGQLDPAMVQQILALQAQQGRRGQVQRQQQLADMMRAQGYDQLMNTKRPGIANVGAAMLNSYAAKKQMDEAAATSSKLDDERLKASKGYFGLIEGLRAAGQ